MQLVTWNTQWCRGLDGRVDPARIVQYALALGDVDVLCLQEIAVNYPGLAGAPGDQVAQVQSALPAGWQAHAEWAHFGGISLARAPLAEHLVALAATLHAAGVRISYDPNFRKLNLNAVLWTAGLDVPAGGVESKVSPEELKANLDPK